MLTSLGSLSIISFHDNPRSHPPLAALAQESRLKLFGLVSKAGPEGSPAGKLAQDLEIAPNTLSFHLKELVYGGLIVPRRQGRFIYYSANPEKFQTLLTFLGAQAQNGVTA